MELDITGKVGIENALELLQERLGKAEEDVREMHRLDIHEKRIYEQYAYMQGLEQAIEIVKLNLPVKTK